MVVDKRLLTSRWKARPLAFSSSMVTVCVHTGTSVVQALHSLICRPWMNVDVYTSH
jgi:hypothetical protein